MVLQLLLSSGTLRGFLRLPDVGSHEDALEGDARACGSGSGLACVSPAGSVLLLNDDGDMVVVVVSVQRAKDDSSPTFFSCVQATLGVVGEQRELLSITAQIHKINSFILTTTTYQYVLYIQTSDDDMQLLLHLYNC